MPMYLFESLKASMEPRLFSRGYGIHTGPPCLLFNSFNGATAFQPWIHFEPAGLFVALSPLQWSHGFSAVDTLTSRRSQPTRKCFNGATAFQPWILTARRHPGLRLRRFNGATAFQPWIPEVAMARALLQDASMEPRLFSRGYLQYSSIST